MEAEKNPSADHLSEDQIAELRDSILADLERLERSMLTTAKALEPVALDHTAVGRLSRIDELQNQGLTRNLSERQQLKLGQLTQALRRLDRGTYGRCVECDGAISYERLQVFPETATCVRCAD